MKMIYIQYFCDVELGEFQGAFDKNGKLIDFWSCSDANWRNEYFSGVMEKIGIKIKSLPKKMHKEGIKQIREEMGS